MAAGVTFTATIDDSKLQAKIIQVSRLTGKTVQEQQRIVMKGLVRDVINFTPPSSQRAHGLDARRAGEVAVVRDMRKIFIPVTLKGKRPEKYPDPRALHHQVMLEAAGRPVRTQLMRFHVDRAKLTSLKSLLQSRVGLLASGWARAAAELEVPVPAWISRWTGSGRGTALQVTITDTKVVMKVTNHMPATAEVIALQTARLINFAKRAAVGKLVRQLPYLLKAKIRGGL